MTEQYWIGGFFIDVSRNQITQNKQSQTLAPKALAVLTCLAEHQGKVVSQEALLAKVWPNTVVSPNTLQRSIAQLRKALGDDGKVQTYIKTHAKQGYSLECDVRWHDKLNETESVNMESDGDVDANEVSTNNVSAINVAAMDGPQDDNSEATSNAANLNAISTHDEHKEQANDLATKPAVLTSKLPKSSVGLVSIAVVIVILGVIGYGYLAFDSPSAHTPSVLTFDRLRSLTATDDKEFDASYSPDGQYIVFHRYLGKQCINRVWAKDVTTQEEILLTKEWGAYSSHSFSKDGKQLVFLATEACREPVTQKSCYDLVSLDFEKSLKSPQKTNLMLQCQNSTVRDPTWLNNNHIALLQKKSQRWKLISYSISDNSSTVLYDLKPGNLLGFSYSSKEDLIAVTGVHGDGQHYLDMLKPDGHLVSSHVLDRPQEIPPFRPIYPSFDPLNKQLLFSTGRQLFTLSYQGKIAKISQPFADRMAVPKFHPEGKSILFIKGPYDSDVVLLSLNQLADKNASAQKQSSQSPSEYVYPSFQRSTQGEDYAIFQPDGDLIAFLSERTGDEQLWISGSDGQGTQKITDFPVDTYIRGMDWAADGNSLLVNANNVLTQVFLDSSQQTIPVKYPVIRLFQWDSIHNTALLIVSVKGVLKFVEYDLAKAEMKELADNKRVIWALRSEDGRLIYKDHLNQLWQPGPAEDQRIEALNQEATKAKTFVINDNVIYAINTDNQLWSYDLNTDTFNILGDVGEDVDDLTDINKTQLLMSIRVSAKKEVVELVVSE
ncbi:winged helix-turn-helix domain-containing protein [Agarilytica rhodophyticola]|uniref:winged helix-turn-helix domain-containing protein n=1 Tax=Agarilytica rhodophyticola TaxID=1737490 RepID=UPI000B349CDA|nr:transcriptional regulator [Agarilytica rhodophyticola]